MKTGIWVSVIFLLLYVLSGLQEIMVVLADPKTTVLQQISMRINVGLVGLALVVCICSLAIIDALERLRLQPASDTHQKVEPSDTQDVAESAASPEPKPQVAPSGAAAVARAYARRNGG